MSDEAYAKPTIERYEVVAEMGPDGRGGETHKSVILKFRYDSQFKLDHFERAAQLHALRQSIQELQAWEKEGRHDPSPASTRYGTLSWHQEAEYWVKAMTDREYETKYAMASGKEISPQLRNPKEHPPAKK